MNCAECDQPIFKGGDGAWYHRRNASVSCDPGSGSDKRARPAS